MPYPKPGVWEFTLEKIGAPELTVRCIEPRSLPAADQRKLQRAVLILQRLSRGVLPDPQDDWVLQAMDEVMAKVIVEWNLPYPEGHPQEGEVIPLRDNPDIFGPLPGDVYEVIAEEIGRRLLQPPKRAG